MAWFKSLPARLLVGALGLGMMYVGTGKLPDVAEATAMRTIGEAFKAGNVELLFTGITLATIGILFSATFAVAETASGIAELGQTHWVLQAVRAFAVVLVAYFTALVFFRVWPWALGSMLLVAAMMLFLSVVFGKRRVV